jgi:hypothetical protein
VCQRNRLAEELHLRRRRVLGICRIDLDKPRKNQWRRSSKDLEGQKDKQKLLAAFFWCCYFQAQLLRLRSPIEIEGTQTINFQPIPPCAAWRPHGIEMGFQSIITTTFPNVSFDSSRA